MSTNTRRFLSTPSARRATRRRPHDHHRKGISIHALREEGDATSCLCVSVSHNFYPRPPRGGRPHWLLALAFHLDFYPRPPRGGRLDFYYPVFANLGISIHALREEGDVSTRKSHCVPNHFYPRPPRGGRRRLSLKCREPALFLSTPSARRATRQVMTSVASRSISIHALREEGDQCRPAYP